MNPQTTTEITVRPVAGAPWYFVSRDGRLYSTLAASNQFTSNRTSLHEVVTPVGKTGYKVIRIRTQDGLKTRTLHSLVAEAFLGPKPDWAKEIRHLDGNKLNCSAENLAYGTRADNAQDRIRHGSHRRGSAVKHARLTDAVVQEIRLAASRGESHASIASRIGISRSVATRAIRGTTWSHVR